ncbi:MAG: MFS transporter [Haloarculaceae archaeon]
MRALEAVRRFDRAVHVVAAGQFLNVLGSGIVYPFATVHFNLAVGIPLAVVGAGLLANNVATAAGTAVGGFLADRRGRKPVMVASMALSAFTLSAYALVRSGTGFVAVATAAGLTAGLYAPAGQAMVADLVDDADRDDAFGLLKVANNVGFGLGFVVGGVLYGVARTTVFIADGATSGLVAVVLVLALPRTLAGRGDGTTGPGSTDRGAALARLRGSLADWGRTVSRRRPLALAALNVGFAVMYAQMQATVPVFAKTAFDLTSEQLGTLYVLNPAVIVLLQLPIVARIGAWRRTRGLAVSAGFWGLSFVAIMLAYGRPRLVGVALVGAFLVSRTLGEILHSPLVTSLGSNLGRADTRGTDLSVLEIAKRLGFGLGSVAGGVFFDYGFEQLLWPTLVFGCGLLAVGAVAFERVVTPAENGVVPAD